MKRTFVLTHTQLYRSIRKALRGSTSSYDINRYASAARFFP